MSEYFYLDEFNQQNGPVDSSQFPSLGVKATTLVWKKGMASWQPAGEIAELAPFLTPPAPQGSPSYTQSTYNSQPPLMLPPSSNLVWAILTTLLCCLPLGIVSIVYASQVDSEWNRGNVEGAYRKSRLARNWAIASAVTGVVLSFIYVIFVVILGVAEFAHY